MLDDGFVYFGANDGWLYALDKSSGNLVWRTGLDDMIRSTPLVWDGVLFVGDDGGALTALDAGTGDVIWRYKTGGAVTAGAYIHAGMLYASSLDRRLHAFELLNVGTQVESGGAGETGQGQ